MLFLAIPLDLAIIDQAGSILSANDPLSDFLRHHRANLAQYLDLALAHIVGFQTQRFVHRHQSQKLHQMILDHVFQRAGLVIITATATLDADEALEVQIPALEMHESYLEILDRHNGQRIVAVLEVLSPANKYAGPGRDSYLAKQREVLASQAHLIEMDLLRRGPHTLAVPEWIARQHASYDYLICVNRAEGLRNRFLLYPRQFRQRLPRIGVPLADGDPDVVLDVQAVLDQTYEAGSYRERLRYDRPCVPSLPAEDQAWADELIRAVQQNAE